MHYQVKINTGTPVSTMAREHGIQILNKEHFIPGRYIAKYSPKSQFIGTTNMTNALSLLLLYASFALANQSVPVQQAVKFNRWYVNQINNDAFPITDSQEIDKYVTELTMKKLRRTQDPRYADEVFCNADIFLKAQYVGDDWPNNVNAIAGDKDLICFNVYIAFGKSKITSSLTV